MMIGERIQKKRQKGQAILELAFLGFLLVLLILIFTEYALFFLSAQKIETLSREAAETAFHNCREQTDAAQRLACLDDVRHNTEQILRNVMRTSAGPVEEQDFRIILTSWQLLGPEGLETVQRTPSAAPLSNPLESGTLAAATRFLGGTEYWTAVETLATQTRGSFSCEIFYRYRTSGGIVKPVNFFGIIFEPPLLNRTLYSENIS